jgi:general secretion pathway protein D
MPFLRLIPLIFLILVNSLYALPDYRNISLTEFASSVASANNINIFIDEDLSHENISFYIPTIKSSKTLLEAFKIAVDKKGLNLVKKGNFFYLSKKMKYRLHNYVFKLSYNSSKDFEKYLKMLGLKYTYFVSNNTFIVTCNYLQKETISKFLISIDKFASQVTLKFYILSYDDSKVKEKGIKFATVYKDVNNITQVALNTLLFPLSTSSNILSSTSFYSAIKFLDTAHLINIKQYPYILVKNNNSFKFESVKNIPYLVKNTKTDSNTVQDNSSYEYKDVGLKIHGIASIYDNFVTLNIDLTIEDVINTTSDTLTPSTNKRYLNSITNLKKGQVLVLSGIKQKTNDVTHIKVPLLSGIPYLGDMFKYDYKTVSTSNIVIAIEVVSDVATATLSPNGGAVSDKEL